MSRDSQAGLIALNRFGLGARGSASGDFVNAASDPRGFVKFELSRPSGALLEVPGLQSTPDLANAVFAYQAEVRKAREAAKSAAAAPSESPPPQPADNTLRRNLSLNAMDVAAQAPAMQTPEMQNPEVKAQEGGGANATMAATEPSAADPSSVRSLKPVIWISLIRCPTRPWSCCTVMRSRTACSG